MERSIRYKFLIDLESIQHKLSSDYSLIIYFSRRFPYINGPSFSPYKPLQNVDFSKVGNMQFFFQELYSHIDKNPGEKFEDMFLVKIANKGTSLINGIYGIAICKSCSGNVFDIQGTCSLWLMTPDVTANRV